MYTADEITFWDRRLRSWVNMLAGLTAMLLVVVLVSTLRANRLFGLIAVVMAPVAFALWRCWRSRRAITTASDPGRVTGRQLDLAQRDLRIAAVLVLPLAFVVTMVILNSVSSGDGGNFMATFFTLGLALIMVPLIASALLFSAASALRRDAAGLPVVA